MREIKFRAFGKKHINKEPEMDYEPNIYDCECLGGWSEVNLNKALNNGGDSDYDRKETKLIFMQYTGLKDKNGKEIWEGDILECFAKNAPDEKIYNHLVELPEFYKEIWSNSGENIFVIGNIYENPELIIK